MLIDFSTIRFFIGVDKGKNVQRKGIISNGSLDFLATPNEPYPILDEPTGCRRIEVDIRIQPGLKPYSQSLSRAQRKPVRASSGV